MEELLLGFGLFKVRCSAKVSGRVIVVEIPGVPVGNTNMIVLGSVVSE